MKALPGPRSLIPGWLALRFRADPLGFLVRTQKEYGDFCAFNVGRSRFFLVNDPDVIREVLITKEEAFTKSPTLRLAKATLGEGLLTSEGEFHKRQRKLSQPAFHPQRVAKYANAMVSRSVQTSESWSDGAAVDMHAEMMRLTLRIVTETLFSASIDSEIDDIGHSMDVLVRMFRRARNPLAPILNRLPLPSNARYLKALRHVRETVARFIAENRAGNVDRADLLSTLIRARDTDDENPDALLSSWAADPSDDLKTGMGDVQLRDEIITLFTAGHETTANALTFTFHLLARHPESRQRLEVELKRELAGREPTVDDLARLPYARAVVAESMRLFPPAWVLMRQAKTDVELGEQAYQVPASSIVVMSQWIAHRDPRWWPEAERFQPDRWFDEDEKRARPRFAYFPFGGGSRSCIGEAFAWTEAVLVLVTLAQKWTMAETSSKPLRLIPTITLRPKDPVLMTIRRRT